MPFCIIETENGWSIVQHADDVTAEVAAEQNHGTLLDPGPYRTWEDADDALTSLQQELDDDSSSDVPATGTLESRIDDRE